MSYPFDKDFRFWVRALIREDKASIPALHRMTLKELIRAGFPDLPETKVRAMARAIGHKPARNTFYQWKHADDAVLKDITLDRLQLHPDHLDILCDIKSIHELKTMSAAVRLSIELVGQIELPAARVPILDTSGTGLFLEGVRVEQEKHVVVLKDLASWYKLTWPEARLLAIQMAGEPT